MIVSRRPLVRHALETVARPLLLLTAWDVVVTVGWFAIGSHRNAFELPLTLFGSAIALFVGFAVNAAYARWWEARTLWGQIINSSRDLSREALTLISGDAGEEGLPREIVLTQIAYVHLLRAALRGQERPMEADVYLTADAIGHLARTQNAPNTVLLHQGRLAAAARAAGLLDSMERTRIETTLVTLASAQGGLERINNTPLPVQYRFFPAVFSRLFCLILPFAVVGDLQWWTPLGSALVGLMFLAAVQMGTDLADPFVDGVYDVPMTALCRTVEIDLLQMIGEPSPERVEPVDHVLW